VATGIQLDLGLIFIGMVLPFWAVIGGLIGLIITIVANPILHHTGILTRWHKGMGTVDTVFANNFDFYMSFGIGLGLSIAGIGIWHVVRSFGSSASQQGQLQGPVHTAPGRGDFNFWIHRHLCVFHPGLRRPVRLAGAHLSLDLFPALRFVYTPIVSYITARMEGIAGPVRQPAPGAGGQLHRRGTLFRLSGH
jgi:hypothetical protein